MKSEEELIETPKIYTFRNLSVVLDSDLALIYGVETRVFNQAFKRNLNRFPEEFAFQLSSDEWSSLRSQYVSLKLSGRGQPCGMCTKN